MGETGLRGGVNGIKSIYVIGSLRNETVPTVSSWLRSTGLEVFDDWFAAGPEADDYWKAYEVAKGNDYRSALSGHAAQHVFNFDKHHLDRVDAGLLVLPAGRSGHLELGYTIGRGKPGFILLDGDYLDEGRFDVMYNFATEVFFSKEEMIEYFK